MSTPLKVESLPVRSEDNPPEGKPFLKEKLSQLPASLNEAIKEHVAKARSSFHPPGHKGRALPYNDLGKAVDFLARDLCESIPSLDDLYRPRGVLQELENRAARVWGAAHSLISVNGASGGIIASLIMLAKRGSTILVPRNCHTSVISGLILGGLTPVWFEPTWESDWGFWGPTTAKEIKQVLQTVDLHQLAGVLVVSPTYAGAISNIRSIAELVHGYGIPLIVDEAHGAHLLTPETQSSAAIQNGADLVVQSLHKTLSGLTQTGIVHISANGKEQFHFSKSELKRALNLVQSTSPSYLFLSSIDQLVSSLESGECIRELCRLSELTERLKEKLSKFQSVEFYQPQANVSFTHILFRCSGHLPDKVCEFLRERGIYAEVCIGKGVLLMLGLGSRISDIESLVFALQELVDPKASGSRKRPWMLQSLAQFERESSYRKGAPREASPLAYSFVSESRQDSNQRLHSFSDAENQGEAFPAAAGRAASVQRTEALPQNHRGGLAPPLRPQDDRLPQGYSKGAPELTDYLSDTEIVRPARLEQELPPREASLLASHMVPKEEAVGLIAAECIAPCPPGWLITVPGVRITSEILKYSNIDFISVISQPT